MEERFIDIESISELHELYDVGKSRHPLITVIDLATHRFKQPKDQVTLRLGFYCVFCKKYAGILKYGRSYYDFSEGSLVFTAPGQALATSPGPQVTEGWALFFHPDLINNSALGRHIQEYTFFRYEANEALHVSEEEKIVLAAVIENIKKEYSQNIDKHTQTLIQSNIELLLNYCTRFYERQFYTREKINSDVVQQFEKLLKEYFEQKTFINGGLPNVKYFASKLNLSANYLSDLLHKFTGKSTLEHIHLQVVEKAKSLLLSTKDSVSEIAYTLGFEHPSHFTRLFKSKTGRSPSSYRTLN